MGLQRTGGFETIAFCEIDPFCRKVLAKHWPGVPCFEDITKLDKEELDSLGRVDVICGGFPCFTAGTLVETSDGYRPIESLDVGCLVKTHKNRFKKVYSVMNREAPILQVDVRGSLPIEATAEHPFLIRRRVDTRPHRGPITHTFGDPEWVCAKDLDESCYVGIPLDIPDPDLRAWESDAFWYIIGRWLGDGWIVNHKRTSKIPQGQRGSRVNSRVWKAIICTGHEDANDLKAKIEKAGFHATESKEETVTKFHISSKELVNFLEPFGKGADGKRIPGFVFKAPLAIKRALFQGWIDSDGYETDKTICGTTVCRELAIGMARIARNTYRIPTTVRLSKVPDKTTIEGRTVSQKPFYQVRVWKTSKMLWNWEDEVCWSQVQSVKNLNSIKTVYNISVEEDETYVANECIVHNCQDISCAGKGAGIHAERSGLWWEMLRIICLVRPKYILVENVAALLNRGLDEVLGSLAESGYDAEWQILHTNWFGGWHRRERLFLVAHPTGKRLVLNSFFKGDRDKISNKGEFWGHSPSIYIEPLGRSFPEIPNHYREDDGLSRRMDRSEFRVKKWSDGPQLPIPTRIKALGNAIVPQCAQFVGQYLLDSIRTEAAQ